MTSPTVLRSQLSLCTYRLLHSDKNESCLNAVKGGVCKDESKTQSACEKALSKYVVTAEAVVPKLDEPVPIVEVVCKELTSSFPTISSARKAVRRGEVTVDGIARKCDWKLRGGELLQRRERAASGRQLEADKVPPTLVLKVLHETDTWAVVLKPEGIPTVEPSEPNGWTAERLLPYFLRPTTETGALWRPRTVHRLDRATSGVLCCAKTRVSLRKLQGAFSERLVKKKYCALLVGKLEGEGVVNLPLKDGKGKLREAITKFKACAHTRSLSWGWITSVELWPETGRTHQLRRHMASLEHPIIGDKKYARSEHIVDGEGLFLSAVELSIPDPEEGSVCGQAKVSVPEPTKFTLLRQKELGLWETDISNSSSPDV
uniref:Pseudouridine synthase n=1 Tax=Tetraselmis sp. GSL018 TaxID=582737 RepID=A0A061S6C4_9CHLO